MVSGPGMAEALETMSRAATRADLVELRLDLIRDYDLELLLRARPCPAVVTFRPRRQGGAYAGDEQPRLAELRRAAELAAEWIDVELDAVSRLGSVAPARRIASYHDFQSVPDGLGVLVSELWAAGTEAVKLAATVERPSDLAPLLGLLSRPPGPAIVLGMGAAGVASRILCLRYPACLLTYVSLDPSQATAPGQLTLDEMDQVYHARTIGPTTRAIGYLGLAEDREVLRNANRELARAGADAVCVPLGTNDGQDGLEAIARLGLDGGVVPIALEERLAGLLPLGEAAAERGRVNAVVVGQGGLVGEWAPDLASQMRCLAASF